MNKPRVKTANAISQRAYMNGYTKQISKVALGVPQVITALLTNNKTINLKLSNPYHQISFKCSFHKFEFSSVTHSMNIHINLNT